MDGSLDLLDRYWTPEMNSKVLRRIRELHCNYIHFFWTFFMDHLEPWPQFLLAIDPFFHILFNRFLTSPIQPGHGNQWFEKRLYGWVSVKICENRVPQNPFDHKLNVAHEHSNLEVTHPCWEMVCTHMYAKRTGGWTWLKPIQKSCGTASKPPSRYHSLTGWRPIPSTKITRNRSDSFGIREISIYPLVMSK